jgi:hypothetical protein
MVGDNKKLETQPSKRGGTQFFYSPFMPGTNKTMNTVTIRDIQFLFCPKCGDQLVTGTVLPRAFPYVHTDLKLVCMGCTTDYLFGIPAVKDAGLSCQIWDTNPVEVIKAFERVCPRPPECPWHKKAMIPTKIFGDWIPDVELVELQWKCPECYLTHHETTKRVAPHMGGSPLTKDEELKLQRRFRELGYIA